MDERNPYDAPKSPYVAPQSAIEEARVSKRRISRFSVHRTALVIGLLYAVLGLILVPFFLIGTLASEGPNKGIGAVLFLFFPIFYGVAGYLGTALGCLLYNLVAGFTGGIEVTVTESAT